MEAILGIIFIVKILLFVYAIWLFFFPLMVIKRMNKIIQLLENNRENDRDKGEI